MATTEVSEEDLDRALALLALEGSWLAKGFEKDPPSADIAWELTYRHYEDVCCHGRNPCVARCGVRGTPCIGSMRARDGVFVRWQPIPRQERWQWLVYLATTGVRTGTETRLVMRGEH